MIDNYIRNLQHKLTNYTIARYVSLYVTYFFINPNAHALLTVSPCIFTQSQKLFWNPWHTARGFQTKKYSTQIIFGCCISPVFYLSLYASQPFITARFMISASFYEIMGNQAEKGIYVGQLPRTG